VGIFGFENFRTGDFTVTRFLVIFIGVLPYMIINTRRGILGIFRFEYFELWGFFGSKMVRKLNCHHKLIFIFSLKQPYIGDAGRRIIFLGILGIFWFENFEFLARKSPKSQKSCW
jgi:hypothetical protein